MVKLPAIRRKTALQLYGAPATVEALETAIEPFTTVKNKYQTYHEFLRMDPELNNAVTRLALLAQYAYKGIYIKAGQELTTEEGIIQANAQQAAEDFNFRGKFFSIAKHLLRDGDEVQVISIDNAAENSIGIRQIQPLPISCLTILDKEENIGKLTTGNTIIQIMEENFYVLNEFDETKKQVFPQADQKVFHIALDNEAEEIRDIYNRLTFGIWSESPLECLRSRVLWKQAILITDVLWRYRNVPREVHELDTSMFTPEKFAGATWEAQVTTATTAAQSYLKEYAKQIQKKKVDQGYVVGSNVKKISYVEPTKVAYTSPNEVIAQINESLREGIGAYSIGKGTYATELVVASYVILMPDWIAYQISRALLEMLKIHLKNKYKYADEELAKLRIRLSLVLDILKGELIRQIAVLAAAGIKTDDELRAMLGDEPLTKTQRTELVKTKAKGGRSSAVQTAMDIAATATRQIEPSTPETPHSRGDKQTT